MITGLCLICIPALAMDVGESFSDPILSSQLAFEAVAVDGAVETSWEAWGVDFMWYKLVRSQSNPEPVYPEDGAIFSSTNQQINSYLDKDPPMGKSFYRICVYTYKRDRYCSHTVAVQYPVPSPSPTVEDSSVGEAEVVVPDEPEMSEIDDVKASFSDIDTDSETGRAILDFAEKGVISGFEGGEFRPNQGITRAELAKVVVLAAGFTTRPQNPRVFCDIYRDDWFFPYVDALVSRGHVNGFPGGDCSFDRKFRPHNQVLRSEAAKIMLEAFGLQSNNITATAGFSDLPADHWFIPYANTLIERGIYTPDEERDFRPNAPATRGEVMLLLNRISERSTRPVSDDLPRIVDHFACSNFCPGDQSQYWVRIYEGVDDVAECEAIGGETFVYYSVRGSVGVCLAEPEIDKPQVECDAQSPCARGDCVVDPRTRLPRCIEEDPCSLCESGKCAIAESYPLQVFCEE